MGEEKPRKFFIVFSGTSATQKNIWGNSDGLVNGPITMDVIRGWESNLKEIHGFSTVGITWYQELEA